MRFQGRICEWHDNKGYGFVQQNGTEIRTFLQIKSFAKKYSRPKLGDSITYVLSKDSKGRNQATEIVNVNMQANLRNSNKEKSNFPIYLAIGFLFTSIVAVIFGKLPNGIPVVITGLSLITFMVYYFDKHAAVNGAWRIQESTLLLLGLLGGWPGAAFAQNSFRHKSSKSSFQIQFWITVVLNTGFLFLLTTHNFQDSSLFNLLSF